MVPGVRDGARAKKEPCACHLRMRGRRPVNKANELVSSETGMGALCLRARGKGQGMTGRSDPGAGRRGDSREKLPSLKPQAFACSHPSTLEALGLQGNPTSPS